MILNKEIPDIESVKPLKDFKLELIYSNGYTGIYDAKELLNYKVFEQLNDVNFFNKVTINYNAIVWNEEIDLCADSIYLKITGEKLSDA